MAPRRINANRREIGKGNLRWGLTQIASPLRTQNRVSPFWVSIGLKIACVCLSQVAEPSISIGCVCLEVFRNRAASAGFVLKVFFCVGSSCQNGTVVSVGQVKTHIRSDKNPSRFQASMVSLPEIC